MTEALVMGYIIPISGAVVIWGGYYIFTSMKRRRPRVETKNEIGKGVEAKEEIITEPIAVRLYDNESRVVNTLTLSGDVAHEVKQACGTLGKTYNLFGKWIYCLNRYQDIKSGSVCYRPGEFMFRASRDHPPSEIYSATELPEVGIAMSVKIPQNFIQKYWPILVFVGVCLMILFMWSQGGY